MEKRERGEKEEEVRREGKKEGVERRREEGVMGEKR